MTVKERAIRDNAPIYKKMYGLSVYSLDKDLEAVNEYIDDDSRILCVAACRRQISAKTDISGVLVITTNKVIFSSKGVWNKPDIACILGSKIHKIQKENPRLSSGGELFIEPVVNSSQKLGNIIMQLHDISKQAYGEILDALNTLKVNSENTKTESSINDVNTKDLAQSIELKSNNNHVGDATRQYSENMTKRFEEAYTKQLDDNPKKEAKPDIKAQQDKDVNFDLNDVISQDLLQDEASETKSEKNNLPPPPPPSSSKSSDDNRMDELPTSELKAEKTIEPEDNTSDEVNDEYNKILEEQTIESPDGINDRNAKLFSNLANNQQNSDNNLSKLFQKPKSFEPEIEIPPYNSNPNFIEELPKPTEPENNNIPPQQTVKFEQNLNNFDAPAQEPNPNNNSFTSYNPHASGNVNRNNLQNKGFARPNYTQPKPHGFGKPQIVPPKPVKPQSSLNNSTPQPQSYQPTRPTTQAPQPQPIKSEPVVQSTPVNDQPIYTSEPLPMNNSFNSQQQNVSPQPVQQPQPQRVQQPELVKPPAQQEEPIIVSEPLPTASVTVDQPKSKKKIKKVKKVSPTKKLSPTKKTTKKPAAKKVAKVPTKKITKKPVKKPTKRLEQKTREIEYGTQPQPTRPMTRTLSDFTKVIQINENLTSKLDLIDEQLRKLKKMFKDGLINEIEYITLRREIMGD